MTSATIIQVLLQCLGAFICVLLVNWLAGMIGAPAILVQAVIIFIVIVTIVKILSLFGIIS